MKAKRLGAALAFVALPALLSAVRARAADEVWTSVIADGCSGVEGKRLSEDAANLLTPMQLDDKQADVNKKPKVDKGVLADVEWLSV